MENNYSVTEEQKKQFASVYLLERMINTPVKFPVLLEDKDVDLEPILEYLLTKRYIDLDKDNNYVPNEKGREVLKNFLARYQDYLKHFDVFCALDLNTGEFAFQRWFDFDDDDDWDDYLNEDRWEDLRVAAAVFKGINPVEIVFMSFLNEKRFGETDEGWQFDLLLGSVWDEILEVCNTALVADDLGYEDEDEGEISGDDVMKDILEQGAKLNWAIRQKEEELEREGYYDDDEDDTYDNSSGDKVVERVVVEEHPQAVYHAYYDPFYVSPIWLALIFI